MAVSPRKVKNKRDANGSLTGRAGTVYDVNIKYTSPDGKKSTYSKKGFLTRKEAEGHEAEIKAKLQALKCSPKVGQKLCGKAILNSVLDRT